MDVETWQKAAGHIKILQKSVECQVCSATLLTPLLSLCAHSACARCFSHSNVCPVCSFTVRPGSLKPNAPLASRAAAILKVVTAFQKLSGRTVSVSSPSCGTDKLLYPDTEDSEDWFFHKDKKFSKKYEKKSRDSSFGIKLQSVSQNDTPLVFPGESIDICTGINDSVLTDRNPDAIDKVKGWLDKVSSMPDSEISSISNINENPVEFSGPVRIAFPDKLCEDFFKKNVDVLQPPPPLESSPESDTSSPVRKTRSAKETKAPKNIKGKVKNQKRKSPEKLRVKSPDKSPNLTPIDSSEQISKIGTFTAPSVNTRSSREKIRNTRSSKGSLSNSRASRELSLNKLSPKNSVSSAGSPSKDTTKSESPKKSTFRSSRLRSKIVCKSDDEISDPIHLEVSNIEDDSGKENKSKKMKNDSFLERFFTKAVKKTKSNLDAAEEKKTEDTSKIDVCQANEIDVKKDKNPWKNVRSMKRSLKKTLRPGLKKLNISKQEHNISISVNQTTDDIEMKGSPINIENIFTQNVIEEQPQNIGEFRSPEAVVRCIVSNSSSTPSSIINLDSPSDIAPRLDKDYLALQQVVKASNNRENLNQTSEEDNEMIQISKTLNRSECSELPLTHFSPAQKNDISKVRKIVESIERKIAVNEILKDFEIEEGDEELFEESLPRSNRAELERQDVEIDLPPNMTLETNSQNSPNKSMQVKPVVKSSSFGVLPFNSHLFINNLSKSSSANLCDTENVTINRKPKIPFIFRGTLKGKEARVKARKIPFYYKSTCTPKDWHNVAQDGLNIEIHRDNVLTSILIRNQPLIDSLRQSKDIKIVSTRDAQTSPIPFSDNYEEDFSNKKNYKISIQPFDNKSSSIKNQETAKISTTPSNVEFISDSGKNVGCISSQSKEIQRKETISTSEVRTLLNDMTDCEDILCIAKAPSEIFSSSHSKHQALMNRPTGASGITEHTSQKTVKALNRSQISVGTNKSGIISSALEMSEPSLNTIFSSNLVKKRKCFADLNDISDSDKLCSKKIKTSKPNGDITINSQLIVSFDSQTQNTNEEVISKVPPAANDSEPESEPMNYNDIICTVFTNIDNDLMLSKTNKQSVSSTKSFTQVLRNPKVLSKDSRRTPLDGSSQINESLAMDKCTQKSSSSEQLYQGNRRDETDLRNITMDIEPDIKYSENIFSMFDKNTITYTQEANNTKEKNSEEQRVRTQLMNLPKTIELLKEESNKAGEKISSKSLCEKTIELSPEEQMLLTPSARAGESLKIDKQNEVFTPQINPCDSDSSMVEDTPQKPRKIILKKSTGDKTNRMSELNRGSGDDVDSSQMMSQYPQKPIEDPENKVIEDIPQSQNYKNTTKATDTPLSISKFNSDVKYRSTPVHVQAKRSLTYVDAMSKISENEEIGVVSEKENFSHNSGSHSRTCMEREFLEEAFDTSNNETVKASSDKSCNVRNSTIIGEVKGGTQSARVMQQKSVEMKLQETTSNQVHTVIIKDICIACSCLSREQITRVKQLVLKMGWTFTNHFVHNLTHLVVGVDENNTSKRSIKYVQALATGKWIVSFAWIDKCLNTNSHASEEVFEVLDSSGEPGPRMSRLRKEKLFEGFTFFCYPSFSVVNEDILTDILKASGADVVNSIEEIEVKDPHKISILLAEPNNTEYDHRFMDLAMERKVVPINFEWILDCLGQGCIERPSNLLLAPRTLLPSVQWPINLASDESMEIQ